MKIILTFLLCTILCMLVLAAWRGVSAGSTEQYKVVSLTFAASRYGKPGDLAEHALTDALNAYSAEGWQVQLMTDRYIILKR